MEVSDIKEKDKMFIKAYRLAKCKNELADLIVQIDKELSQKTTLYYYIENYNKKELEKIASNKIMRLLRRKI